MENTTNNKVFVYEDIPDAIQTSKFIADVYLMVSLSVVCVLGTTGNGLVIWFVAFKMKKTVSTVWILSLAIADFTFSLFQPLEVTRLALDSYWPFGGPMCKLNSFFVHLNMFSSILQLTVISMDRCVCVVFPFWCQNPKRMRLAWKVILGVWALAVVCSVPFFIYKEIFTDSYGWVYCFDAFDEGEPFHRAQVIMRFIVFFLIPFIIIASCYTVIICRISRNPMITSTKPLKMIVAVIISFFICWLPYHVFSFIFILTFKSYKDYTSAVGFGLLISTSLAYANSFINPFLYVFFGQNFKEKFCGSIHSALSRSLAEDNQWTDPKRKRAQS